MYKKISNTLRVYVMIKTTFYCSDNRYRYDMKTTIQVHEVELENNNIGQAALAITCQKWFVKVPISTKNTHRI